MDTMPCKLGAYRLPRGVAGHGAVIIMHLDRVRVNAHLTLDPSCYLSSPLVQEKVSALVKPDMRAGVGLEAARGCLESPRPYSTQRYSGFSVDVVLKNIREMS